MTTPHPTKRHRHRDEKKIAIYPGTFDPLTLGHLDILRRAASVCDELIVGVAENTGKSPLFTIDERINLVNEVIDFEVKKERMPDNIKVIGFDDLLVEFAHRQRCLCYHKRSACCL